MSSLLKCNIAIDLYCAFICLIIIVSIFLNNKNRNKNDFDFCITCLFCFFLSLADAIGWFLDGKNSVVFNIMYIISNFVYYEFGMLVCNVYIIFLLNLLLPKFKNKIYHTINFSIAFVYSFFLIINLFIPVYYTISPENVYSRANLYWISLFLQFSCYILSMVIIFSPRAEIQRRQRSILALFVIFPFLAQVMQALFYGIAFINAGITLSFFIIYIFLNDKLELSVDKRRKKILIDEEKILNIQENTISALANLVESRDSDTGNHVKRTSLYVKLLANAAKDAGLYPELLTDYNIDLMVKAAPMHDIGKIVVADYILKKPGKLTDEEFDLMKRHTVEGKRIVNDVLGMGQNKDYIRITCEIATSHHEKWNGSGYPYKLSGEDIPLSARIMAVADVFDALVSPRCYKEPFSIEKAFEILQKDAGSHFDPNLVPVFISLEPQLLEIMEKYGSLS